jgi:acetylornithine deacetylase
VALLVGEENEGDGANAFLREARPGRVLVGEPTGLALCTSHYGYLEVALSAWGRRAHASIPERGHNAAETVLVALHSLLQQRNSTGSGPVLNVRHFATANPGFAVPERASAWVDIHLPPGQSVAEAIEDVRRALAVPGAERLEVEFPTIQEGFSVSEEELLIRAYRALGRQAVDVFRSHSDANLFHQAGVPTLVLGPGRLEYAHSAEERIELAEVEDAAQLYVDLAAQFLG